MQHPVKLVSVGTAVPPHVIDQRDAARASHAAFSSRFGDFEKLAKVFDTSGIQRRYGVRPIEWYLETSGWPERNLAHIEGAGAMFVSAASKALASAGLAAGDVDTIVTVSSTGIATPSLTRSSLHRCLQRHGISRLPEVKGDKEPKKKFKSYPIGYFHVDIAEVQTAEGKLYLFVAIDRTSKFAFAELYAKAGKMNAAQFLRNLIAAVPYTIHTILTDNGIQFTNRACDQNAFHHIFDRVCEEYEIEHRLTKVKHPWTNGQVERMNRTIKEATVKRFHYDDHAQLKKHLADFIDAYNFGRRLKTLKGLTPYEFICKRWTSEPDRFIIDPIHQMPGLNT